MNVARTKRLSKFLSLVLRHQPETVGLELDSAGWVDIDALLEALAKNGKELSLEQLRLIVDVNDKQRFAISDDGMQIRANQGHSVEVDLGYEPCEPPEVLYHGTPDRFVESIRVQGLKKMARHHVHMHADSKLATEVGGRRGKPALLTIEAAAMEAAGHEFFLAENNVWLVEHVPPEFIVFPEDAS